MVDFPTNAVQKTPFVSQLKIMGGYLGVRGMPTMQTYIGIKLLLMVIAVSLSLEEFSGGLLIRS